MTLLVNFIIFSVLCYSFSNLFIYAKGPFNMFGVIRNIADNIGLGEVFSCMMCLPLWVGVTLSLIDVLLLPTPFTPFSVILDSLELNLWVIVAIVLLDGVLSSGVTWLIHNIEEFFESNAKLE